MFKRNHCENKEQPAIDPRSTVDLLKELWDVHTPPKKREQPPAAVNSDIYSLPSHHQPARGS